MAALLAVRQGVPVVGVVALVAGLLEVEAVVSEVRGVRVVTVDVVVAALVGRTPGSRGSGVRGGKSSSVDVVVAALVAELLAVHIVQW